MASALLVVAISGRALAGSARRGGYDVIVLDRFNDLDTRRFAKETRIIPGIGIHFDHAALLQMVQELAPTVEGVVVGTGFENAPQLLDEIADLSELYGNKAHVVRQLKEPNIFFPLLDALDIPHPEISLTVPESETDWLMKKTGGCGGEHIRPVTRNTKTEEGYYFQRLAPGKRASVLFLADGSRAQIIGFNEQLSTGDRETLYWYAGAVNRLELPATIESGIRSKLDKLMEATELVGLNGMDFIVNGNDYQVLEINPRPPVTLDLHDVDYSSGLFHLHVAACKGNLPESIPESREVRAHAVIYAPAAFTASADFHFPDWCTEVPAAGSEFSKRSPVCMVQASGNDVLETKTLLHRRRAQIEQTILETLH